MRYQFGVSDLAHRQLLTHLSPAATRLSAALARPRLIALACIAALTALGWLALGLMAAEQGAAPLSFAVLCRLNPSSGGNELALAVPMWAAMVLAMMLPTAGPMILTYAEIADTAARKREAVVSPLLLTAGYGAAWLGFALLAAALQWALARAGLLHAGKASELLAGTIFLAAGLYQFSAVKQACLTLCQRPFPYFFANWTTEPRGVLRLGLRQGLYCLGCCGAMMLIMFSVGVMNVAWMAALGVIMTIEKMTTTARFSQAVGTVLVAIGFGLVATSVL
jgi:predicted metal-binding membrane protein